MQLCEGVYIQHYFEGFYFHTENVENYKGDKDIDDILKDLGEVTEDSSGKPLTGKKIKGKKSILYYH